MNKINWSKDTFLLITNMYRTEITAEQERYAKARLVDGVSRKDAVERFDVTHTPIHRAVKHYEKLLEKYLTDNNLEQVITFQPKHKFDE